MLLDGVLLSLMFFFVGGLSKGRLRKEAVTFFKDVCDPDFTVCVCDTHTCLVSRV